MDIGVVTYLDGQLAGDWGAGARLYRDGPFIEPAQSGYGYQLPLTPRALYKHVLPTIDAHAKKHHGGRPVPELTHEEQDKLLGALEAGKVDLGLADGPNGFTSAEFFTSSSRTSPKACSPTRSRRQPERRRLEVDPLPRRPDGLRRPVLLVLQQLAHAL